MTEPVIFNGDCRDIMEMFIEPESIDAIVTDPPYGLGFMGKDWDHGVPGVEFWKRAYAVLKPGGHLLAFGGARTYHRLTCAIEDAGFEIRDQIMWVYGSGFPKSLDVSKAIDKAAGAVREVTREGQTKAAALSGQFDQAPSSERERRDAPATDAAKQWDGWGTALKPAHEPICVARKPLAEKTVSANVLQFGTGALNIDACRVGNETITTKGSSKIGTTAFGDYSGMTPTDHVGRWPANLIHDGSDAVVSRFPTSKSGVQTQPLGTGGLFSGKSNTPCGTQYGDTGSAARFFYCTKASRKDRNEGMEDPGPQFTHGATLRKIENTDTVGNNHPTVKPTDLMAYLCRLVTPPGGVVLDPFMGSGSTGKAARREGFRFVGIELEDDYFRIAKARLSV